jgi:5'-nucleotidase
MARAKKAAPADRPLRILLSNDDGIHAPGLKVLHRIARQLSTDIWIVAPEFEQSGASHSLTLTLPLRVRRVGPRRFAVQGTPTDSVMMAVKSILDRPPDLVLSGVNRGANLADDVTYSGTIAAAMEGTLLGIRSVALSQTYGPDGEVPWQTAEHHGVTVLRRLLEAGWPPNVLINVNFPDAEPDAVGAVRVTRQGRRDQSNVRVEQRTDARGNPYFWVGFERIRSNPPEGTDLNAIYAGDISVTPLHLDLTERRAAAGLERAFAAEGVLAGEGAG